ncbi:RNA-binding protein [Methanonatronarchaeum sp. AMET-Sl]|uniref:RNA-binding protein n=1 Tax=Methanonatronarchaeum sp. AMET-Sl TaxID=3037654 RepID=UPI00244DF97C|nr:RNA-binding protein [Methanonatronarchaeum sp. AMET-Sl]WGI16678.1 RNA-binding protein [Methanonatronarchaeum sp. AMET-Sl]
MKITSRHHMRSDKIRDLRNEINEMFGSDVIKLDSDVEVAETDEGHNLIFIDKEPVLMEFGDDVFLTIVGALNNDVDKRRVVVDQGAIPFLLNGADLMAPGVVTADVDIGVNDLFLVVEEEHEKPIAVCRAVEDGVFMVESDSGKVGENVHYVQDELWDFLKDV